MTPEHTESIEGFASGVARCHHVKASGDANSAQIWLRGRSVCDVIGTERTIGVCHVAESRVSLAGAAESAGNVTGRMRSDGSWQGRTSRNRQVGSSPPCSDANMEPNTGDAPMATNETTAFDSQVRITFHHTRGRLADIDGLSGKAAIDGLVEAGILSTDSAKQVAEVRTYQVKGKPEETRIVIEKMEGV